MKIIDPAAKRHQTSLDDIFDMTQKLTIKQANSTMSIVYIRMMGKTRSH